MFVADGYAATSIKAIASSVEVSDQTVYNAFGDKPSLLVAIGERIIAGDVAPGAGDRDFEAKLGAAADQHARIAVAAAWSRMIWEQGMLRFESMLLDAAATDPRAAEIARTMWQRKFDENRAPFALVFPPETFGADISFDEAYDLFFAMDSAAFVRILIEDRGWTWDAYERLIAATLERLFARA